MNQYPLQHRVRARRPHIVIHPSASVLALIVLAAGVGAHAVHRVAAGFGVVTASSLGPVCFVAVFAAGYFALLLMHEVGHGLVILALGRTWERLEIAALRVSVGSPGPPSHLQQLLISVGGPVLHMAAGIVLVIAASGSWTLVWMLGALGVLEGAANLVLPLGRGSDGYKLAQSVWAIVRGRGGAVRVSPDRS